MLSSCAAQLWPRTQPGGPQSENWATGEHADNADILGFPWSRWSSLGKWAKTQHAHCHAHRPRAAARTRPLSLCLNLGPRLYHNLIMWPRAQLWASRSPSVKWGNGLPLPQLCRGVDKAVEVQLLEEMSQYRGLEQGTSPLPISAGPEP